MAENNTSNTSSATSSATNAKRRIVIPVAVCLVLVVIFLALFFGSVSLYKKAAEKGSKEAQFTLGMHYRYGLGVKQDTVKAWDLWRKAAEQNLKPAQDKLAKIHKDIEKAASAENADDRVLMAWGKCLANDWGPKQDQAAAFDVYKKVADRGNPEAYYEMGLCFLDGKGVDKDNLNAFDQFITAAEKNHKPALQKLAEIQSDIEKAAVAGNADPRAQFAWGKCLANGWGPQQDALEGWLFWWKASAQDFDPAKQMFVTLRKDIEAAAKADKADARAQLVWGMCLNNGWGIEQNEADALVWLNKAGETVLRIQYELGLSYDNGIGVKKDEKTAFDWFSKAAEKNYVEAQYEVAQRFLDGKGVDKDETNAFDWFVKAAEHNSYPAKKKLADIQADIEKAASAENANDRVLLVWGKCLANGWGPKQDEAAAFEWYKKAAEKGNAEAKDFVEKKEQEEAEKLRKQKEAEEQKKAEELKNAEEQSPAADQNDSADTPEKIEAETVPVETEAGAETVSVEAEAETDKVEEVTPEAAPEAIPEAAPEAAPEEASETVPEAAPEVASIAEEPAKEQDAE